MEFLNRRGFLKGGVAAGALMLSGCGEFFRTDEIIKNAEDIIKTRKEFTDKIVEGRDNFVNEIIKKREKLILDYVVESGTKELDHLPRKKVSLVRENGNGTYTLTYQVEFADTASLKTLVDEQLNGLLKKEEKKVVVTPLIDTNELIITFKEKSDLSQLEAILGDADCLPPQILLKFKATADFGDKAQDYASELNFELKTKGGDFGAITDKAKFPGGLERIRTRIDMGAIWSAQIDTSLFDLKAILNVLETWGYSRNIFETYILLSNGKEGSLSGWEKLPIPEQILSGVTPVVTQKMEDIKSNFKGNAKVYDEIVRLTATASVGNAKRPDIKRPDFLVPAGDEVSIQDVLLPIGVPYIIGGKLIEMEIGVHRRDSILPWFSGSKDYEKRSTRILYEVTPESVVNWKKSKLGRPIIKYEAPALIEIPQKSAA